jgi:type II secretory pathway component PulJ
MKKGIVLMEIVLALAIFMAVALPIFYLSMENQAATRYTQQQEQSTDALSNSLEILYSGGYKSLMEQVESLGYAEDDYLFLGISYSRKWEYLNPLEKIEPMQLRLILTWQTGNGTEYETSLDFIYRQKEGIHLT